MRSYLALCRLPAVFTAVADIVLGYVLTSGPVVSARLGWGLVASAGLYLGGMVLNDLLDQERDTAERPSRPLPSGRVTRAAAWRFYAVLTLGGILAAALASQWALMVAVAVALLVWLYDGPLKRTPLAPVVMGLCRTGNILLGAAVGAVVWSAVMEPRVLWVAAAMGIYVCGITVFARDEAGASRRATLLLGWLLVNVGLSAGVALCGWVREDTTPPRLLLGLIVIVLIINQRLARAIVTPSPETVQAGVKTMLLAIPILDACFVAFAVGGHTIWWPAATVALVVPAMFLGRFLKLT